MKIYFIKTITVLVALFIFISIGQNIYAEDKEYSWFLKRNKGGCPTFPNESELFSQYNAYCVDVNAVRNKDRVIYLTFDAGYENGNVEKILNTLNAESVPAAFFLLDNIILKNTDLVIKMKENGHLVCNHTKNHKNLSKSSEEEISENLKSLEKLYEENTGYKMDMYFRFPEGKYSIEALDCINKLGYKTVFWSFAYDDWDNGRQMNKEKAMKKILDHTHEGAIILLHPTSSTNAEILPDLIREWKSRGYRFGTLDELTK